MWIPHDVWRRRALATALFALGTAGGCGPEVSTTERDGALRGQLVRWTFRNFDDTTTTSYRLRVGESERELVLDPTTTLPELPPFAEVKVWGTDAGGKLRVDRITPVEPGSSGGAPPTTGGAPGTGGASASGGAPGTGGAPTGTTGGSPGATGGDGVGGCSCRTVDGPTSASAVLLIVALAFSARSRSRHCRSPSP